VAAASCSLRVGFRCRATSILNSLYVLLNTCQGIVGHLKQDFDTGAYLSGIYLYVTNVLFYYFAFYPIMPFTVRAQSVQDRKQRLAIQAGPYPQCACSSHIYTHSWLLRPSDRINLSSPDNNPLENNIVDHGSLHRRVVKINWPEQFSSRSIPANV
jgi:hypothetical protein